MIGLKDSTQHAEHQTGDRGKFNNVFLEHTEFKEDWFWCRSGTGFTDILKRF